MKIKKIYDVIIIGAGPAGLACALEASKENVPVLVIEKQSKPGLNNSCAGGISEGIVKKYNIPDHLLKRTKEYKIHFKNKYYSFRLKDNSPILTTIKREHLEGYLFELANKNESISFELNTNVYDVKRENELYKIYAKDKSGNKKHFYSKYVVFADGPHTLAKRFGLGTKINNRSYIAFSGYSDEKKESANLFIENGDFGYLWYFPHVNNTNIGYGRLLGNKRKYVQILKKYKGKLEHLTAGLIPTNLVKKFYKKGLYVIGDAAGLVNPITGGGIIYAFISGIKAGENLRSKIFNNNKNFNSVMFYDKGYIWLIFMHTIYWMFYFFYKIGVKSAYFQMLFFYFKLMQILFKFTKSV